MAVIGAAVGTLLVVIMGTGQIMTLGALAMLDAALILTMIAYLAALADHAPIQDINGAPGEYMVLDSVFNFQNASLPARLLAALVPCLADGERKVVLPPTVALIRNPVMPELVSIVATEVATTVKIAQLVPAIAVPVLAFLPIPVAPLVLA